LDASPFVSIAAAEEEEAAEGLFEGFVLVAFAFAFADEAALEGAAAAFAAGM
jgi:hypothetical protein